MINDTKNKRGAAVSMHTRQVFCRRQAPTSLWEFREKTNWISVLDATIRSRF